MKNCALDFISQRRSIRKFKSKPVPREMIDLVAKAGQQAPTNCGLQAYSFVFVTNPEIREDIFEAIGRHGFMEEAPVWIVICADLARQFELFKLIGVKVEFRELGKLILSIIDAMLAAENMVIAAEMLGLGSVFVGSILDAMKRVAEILKLPKDVLPLVLLCLGYPDEAPPLRPRWPLKAVLHENAYTMPSRKLMGKYYEEANRRLVEMRYFKEGIKSWAEHWQAKFKIEDSKKWEEVLRKDLRELGFLP